MRALARIGLLALLLVATAVAVTPSVAEARGTGSQPLDDIRFWADQKKQCGLGRDQLAAMMMAVTYPEAGASGEQAPSPMTLSRYDTNAGLYAFGDRNTPWKRAFWHPGIGMWAFDSAGGWNLTAVGAISTWTAAEQAASVMVSRWCANPSRSYVWAPWYACASSSVCEDIYNDIYDGSSLRNLTIHPNVGRDGGMEARSCTVGSVTVFCWYIDPARAQGANWWTAPSAGPSPISAPFYVVSMNGRETRYWLAQDTGFLLSIKADKPVTANARTSLTWSTSSELCDTTQGRGDCGSGGRVASTPWGPRTAVPFGSFDLASASIGAVDVSGWAVDPDTNDPIDVHVYVDGQILGAVRADRPRPDVAGAVPGYGDRHGFTARLGRVGGGAHQVCAYAINVGPLGNDNPLLGCRAVTVGADPTGSFDGWVTSSPGIRVNGWALDPDTSGPIGVHVYVDGQFAGQGTTNTSRPDVGSAFAWAGPNRGFEIEVPALPGSHQVCAYALNAGPGGNRLISCKSVAVPDRTPYGSFDSASRAANGAVHLRGWTIDPDLVFPIDVHVYLNGAFAVALPATVSRPDVGAAFPIFGPYHGFDVIVAAPAGPVQACVYAINWGPGWGNPLIGCRTVA
jgi:hypothetical protein